MTKKSPSAQKEIPIALEKRKGNKKGVGQVVKYQFMFRKIFYSIYIIN